MAYHCRLRIALEATIGFEYSFFISCCISRWLRYGKRRYPVFNPDTHEFPKLEIATRRQVCLWIVSVNVADNPTSQPVGAADTISIRIVENHHIIAILHILEDVHGLVVLTKTTIHFIDDFLSQVLRLTV